MAHSNIHMISWSPASNYCPTQNLRMEFLKHPELIIWNIFFFNSICTFSFFNTIAYTLKPKFHHFLNLHWSTSSPDRKLSISLNFPGLRSKNCWLFQIARSLHLGKRQWPNTLAFWQYSKIFYWLQLSSTMVG